jgi:ABC-2 type transport system permease protein
MIRRIAAKEWLEIVRDGRFRVLSAVVLLLAIAAIASGWTRYRDIQRQHSEAQQATRAQWLSQPAKNPHSAAHYGMYAFKPKSRLSMVDSGVDPYVGVAAWLEAHKQNEFAYRPAQDATSAQRFGDLTAAEGMLVLLPLFIVLVAFSAFTGEREQGTLRQLMSLGVRRADLFLGKALGVAGALAVVVVPVTIAGVVALSLTSEFGSPLRDLSRATLLGLTYLAYFAIIIAVALGVSARMRSSRAALVVLLSLWFVNTLMAPRVATDAAAALHPTPSAVEFQQAIEKDLSDAEDMRRRLEAKRQDLMRAHNVTSIDAVPVNFAGISLQTGEERGNEVFDRHYGALFETFDRQQRVVTLAGVIAPLLPVRALSMALAGTDVAHHRAFVNAAESYRRDIQRVMNADIAQHAKPGVVYTAGPDLWAQVPEFSYEPPGMAAVLTDQRGSLLVLAAWLAAAIWFGARSVARLAAD